MRTGNPISSILLALWCFGGCDSRLADSPMPGYLILRMTTDPGLSGIRAGDSLLVNIVYIRIYKGPDEREWAAIADTNRLYNLFGLINGLEVPVGNRERTELPPASFSRFRIRILLHDSVMTLMSKKFTVYIPDQSYEVVDLGYDVSVQELKTAELSVVFDAFASLKLQQGKYIFVPSFRIQP